MPKSSRGEEEGEGDRGGRGGRRERRAFFSSFLKAEMQLGLN
jgi:hypothetical protein